MALDVCNISGILQGPGSATVSPNTAVWPVASQVTAVTTCQSNDVMVVIAQCHYF